MFNENYRAINPSDVLKRLDDDVLRRGDRVRALRGRSPDQGQTGIVTGVSWGKATVRWTSEDVTTIPVKHLSKITGN